MRILALAALLVALAGCAIVNGGAADRDPELSIRGDRFLLDGRPFDMWGIRVASATQSDSLTERLVESLDDYRAHGVNTLAVFYMGSRGANSDPFSPDGLRIDAAHQARMERLIRAAAARDMVVVVGIFYQHAPFGLRDAEAVRNATRTATESLRPFRNVIVNIANEQNSYGWQDTAPIWDFRDPERILELTRLVATTDPRRLVGAGGYDHDKNIVIGLDPSVDALLFDTSTPDPDSGELYDRFVAAGIRDKPLVNVELFGGWTGNFPIGVFPDSVRAAYQAEIDAAARRPGLYVFFHNNRWLQEEGAIRYDLGGQGTPDDPGMRWYFEAVRHARTQR